jgi:hypothetical protein
LFLIDLVRAVDPTVISIQHVLAAGTASADLLNAQVGNTFFQLDLKIIDSMFWGVYGVLAVLYLCNLKILWKGEQKWFLYLLVL